VIVAGLSIWFAIAVLAMKVAIIELSREPSICFIFPPDFKSYDQPLVQDLYQVYFLFISVGYLEVMG
jgi:hypothetical protein